jgi:hypothetical protein
VLYHEEKLTLALERAHMPRELRKPGQPARCNCVAGSTWTPSTNLTPARTRRQ